MGKFQSILPSSLLAPYIREYWFLSDDAAEGLQRTVPSGCMGLVFNRSRKIFSKEYSLFPDAYLFGQSVRPVDLWFNNLDLIIVIFRPIGVKAFFNVAADELKGLNIELSLLSSNLSDLQSHLYDTKDNRTCVARIESFLLSHMHEHDRYNYKRLLTVILAIETGESNISRLADIACLGYKQFKRIFSEYTGLNPKEFIRIHRFSKTLFLLQTDAHLNLEDLAGECGYFDKSHLIREVKLFSGYTPNEFLRNSDPYSEGRLLFQSFFVDIK